jgi:hypothetical protein
MGWGRQQGRNPINWKHALGPSRPPILQGVLPINGSQVPGDLVAGMPVMTGLYTLLIPLAMFTLLGSSRHPRVRVTH